jgi:hypothetical protein
LGLVAFGNQQLAFDAVCCHIIGIDPLSVDHLRLAHERGFGTVDLNQIEILGDISLEECQALAKGFRVGLIPVDQYFKDTNIKAYSGKPPQDGNEDGLNRKEEDYCWGGCPGALEEAIEILRIYDQDTDEKLPKSHIVFGQYEGKIDAKEDESVIFIGDCASYKGEIHGKEVQIESRYRSRSTIEPLKAKAEDIFYKIVKVQLSAQKNVMRMEGCPVSVAEQVLMLVKLGKLKNPYLDPKQSLSFVSCYLSWRTQHLINRIFGHKDQEKPRGLARPLQNIEKQ